MNEQEKQLKVALVTGGGEGIGRATCLRLYEEGYAVAVLGRTAENIERVAAKIREGGGDAIAIQADIASDADLCRAYNRIESHWGRLDVLFAHAGINGVWAPLRELKPEEWEKTIRINLTGTFFTVRRALPLLERQGGSIIITASVNGTRMFSNTGASAYATSKAGIVGFMKMISLELAKHRIRVNCVSPGAIDTNISENTTQRNLSREQEPVKYPDGRIPLTRGKPGKPEQVADLVAFLASDHASHITGTNIFIDGAQSLLMG